jgi:hypothetical protein
MAPVAATQSTQGVQGVHSADKEVTRIPTRRYRLLRGTISRREHSAAHRDASTGKINDQYLNGVTVVYCAYDPQKENSAGDIIELTDEEAVPFLDANPPRVELIGGAGAHRVQAAQVPPRQHPFVAAAQAPAPAPASPAPATVPPQVTSEPEPPPEEIHADDESPMVGILYGMNAPAAIELINGMETVEELQVALKAEEQGRNRKGVKDAITARFPEEV